MRGNKKIDRLYLADRTKKKKQEKRNMPKISVEETLKLIPTLFEINLNTDKSGVLIFEKLSQILDFDEAFIYFLNPESLQLKYSFKEHKNYKANSIFEMSAGLKKQLFTKEGKLLLPDDEFIKTVGLSELKKKSYILLNVSYNLSTCFYYLTYYIKLKQITQ